MSKIHYSVALGPDLEQRLVNHLLQHIRQGRRQEDMCFALWRPSTGTTRTTAVLTNIILPRQRERKLHGGASFQPSYLERVISAALQYEAGIAFLHSHFTPGWQGMSLDDVKAEEYLAPRISAATRLPLVGLTMGTDGALSARFWPRVGRKKIEWKWGLFPQVVHRKFKRHWCGTVRFVADGLRVTFMEQQIPKPVYKKRLKRTYSAWGEEKQNLLARLHCGIVGAGSVGSIVAEGLVRMGVQTVSLIDFDHVEEHNLDRLIYATTADIGRKKVNVVKEAARRHATADQADIRAYPYSVTRDDGLQRALDCDILFSCVDRPWPRQVLNMLAYAHRIPVVDGGVHVRVTHSQKLRSADWRAHVALPGRPCLECLGQFDPADVIMERQGLLDDPRYIAGLPVDHHIRRNENVFAFALNAAGQMLLQFLSLTVQPSGISNTGAHLYHFVPGTLDKDSLTTCKSTCLFKDHVDAGDSFPFPLI